MFLLLNYFHGCGHDRDGGDEHRHHGHDGGGDDDLHDDGDPYHGVGHKNQLMNLVKQALSHHNSVHPKQQYSAKILPNSVT